MVVIGGNGLLRQGKLGQNGPCSLGPNKIILIKLIIIIKTITINKWHETILKRIKFKYEPHLDANMTFKMSNICHEQI